MEVRFAQESDWPVVLEYVRNFHKQSVYSDIPVTEDCHSLFQLILSQNMLVVVEDGNKVVGICGGLVAPIPFNPKLTMAQELFWWIEPEYRDGGAGKQLLEGYQLACKANGVALLFLSSLEGVEPEKADYIYKRYGFEKAENVYAKKVK